MNRPEPIELENNLGPDAVTGEINRIPWMAYDVDEMDIYIAEKDKEIAELQKQVHDYAQGLYVIQARAEKEACHQKHKRCLAMADINWWQANRYSAAEMVERIRGNFEEATQCSKLEEKYLKRYNKWLALAEEHTWAKFLQLIHNEV